MISATPPCSQSKLVHLNLPATAVHLAQLRSAEGKRRQGQVWPTSGLVRASYPSSSLWPLSLSYSLHNVKAFWVFLKRSYLFFFMTIFWVSYHSFLFSPFLPSPLLNRSIFSTFLSLFITQTREKDLSRGGIQPPGPAWLPIHGKCTLFPLNEKGFRRCISILINLPWEITGFL